MKVYEDLNHYNGDTAHDMYVDYDYEINTGEFPKILDKADLNDYIDILTTRIDG